MTSSASAIDLVRAGTSFGLRLVGMTTRAPLMLTAPLVRPRPEASASPVVLRSGGAEVPLDADSLEDAFPHATDRLVVLVPDGTDDETSWDADLDQVGGTYASRLAQLLDWTPVHLQVHSDLDPAELGVELSAVLQRLVEFWPVELRRIAFLGHGSGGLGVRAACGVANLDPKSWDRLVTDVIALGTPHLAVPAGRVLPQLGRDLEEKLAGITTVDRADPEVSALPEVSYALITPRSRVQPNLLGGMLGNLLWWRQRATLRPRRAHALFPTAQIHHVETDQLGLTNHPDVHAALMAWLA